VGYGASFLFVGATALGAADPGHIGAAHPGGG
jgi:hypothetical protein